MREYHRPMREFLDMPAPDALLALEYATVCQDHEYACYELNKPETK
jgi:hypothetical protein